MVAACLKWERRLSVGLVKITNGDVQSDTVGAGLWLAGTDDFGAACRRTAKTIESEAAHGTVTRHYRLHQQGKPTSTNRSRFIYA